MATNGSEFPWKIGQFFNSCHVDKLIPSAILFIRYSVSLYLFVYIYIYIHNSIFIHYSGIDLGQEDKVKLLLYVVCKAVYISHCFIQCTPYIGKPILHHP